MSLPNLAATPDRGRPLGMRAIGRFALPLMLNAWLMTLAGPVLNVAIGRAAEPRMQLAAFWIAFTILLVCQCACLVTQQVTAAALHRRESFGAVATSSALIAVASALLVAAIAVTPAGDIVFHRLIPTPSRTAMLAREVLLVLSVIPLLVAVRGLASGLAVYDRRTELLAMATFVRLLVLAAVAAAVVGLGWGTGAIPAAWMLVGATAAEAAFLATAAFLRARHPAAAEPAGERHGSLVPVLRLALPLAAASLVWTVARPLVGAVLARLAEPELAQAGFGIVFPILLVTCAPLWVFLDVAIVLPRSADDVRCVARFAALAALAFTAGVSALAWTPFGGRVLCFGIAMPPELARQVLPALALVAFEPLVLSARAVSQGLLVRSGRTAMVLALSPIKLVFMLAAGLLVARLAPYANGAALALALFIGGDAIDAVLFGAAAWRAARSASGLHVLAASGSAGVPWLDRRRAA